MVAVRLSFPVSPTRVGVLEAKAEPQAQVLWYVTNGFSLGGQREESGESVNKLCSHSKRILLASV